ncbi:MAG TPA: hypothetical protein VEG08_10270, partial [Terriglobales bacterium]|nr:hypothetical protein [Terriglobales bacterium]
MTEDRVHTAVFEEMIRELAARGVPFRFRARGQSMAPAILDGEILEVCPVASAELRRGDIVLFREGTRFKAHRLLRADHAAGNFLTRGDSSQEADAPVQAHQIVGKVVTTLRGGRRGGNLGPLAWRLRSAWRQFRRLPLSWVAAVLLLLLALAVPRTARAQVAVDSTTSGSAALTNGAPSLTFNHTTAGANRLLVVAVSMNISGNAGATVSGVTYNGAALSFAGAHTFNNQRVEMWRRIAPATGTNATVVTVNFPGGTGTVRVVAGAITFTGTDQAAPLGPFQHNEGAAGTLSSIDVASATGELVLDAVAVQGNRTLAAVGETQQWNARSGANATDARGQGNTNPGAPSVPMGETIGGGTSDWQVGAVSIRPPALPDLAVGLSTAGAVFLGQNLTYTATVTNNGLATATNVVLTLPSAGSLPAGLAIVSATFGASNCTVTTNIVCNLGALATGASTTVTIVASAAAIGVYPLSGTATETETDFNPANNTASASGIVQASLCGRAGKDGNGGTLAGIVNTYYAGTASVAAGATSIPVGLQTGAATPIGAGDLLLVIQMQDAAINSSNTTSYGDGSTGSGATSLNNSGGFEYVLATGPVSAGSVPIRGGGSGGGLLFGYTFTAAATNVAPHTYQVVRVPQYLTATLGSSLTALPWNGRTGGILAFDVAGTLNLGSATVRVDGLGFRGAGGLQLNGGAGANTDYVQPAVATYTGVVEGGAQGCKGEGIAGTPLWVAVGGSFQQTVADSYPSAGGGGSTARGAPGNAGGGGTDGNPAANDQNSGGGGGGNGGAGGLGGNSWNSNLPVGGLGGAAFPASVSRLALGGGGGAGTRNNSPGDDQASGGAPGGGMVLIRAASLSGNGTITANGLAAYNNTANDGGGGGGAGGSVMVLAGGGTGGLTVQAHGGRGGDAWNTQAFALNQRHGPGGGGGGGVIVLSGAAAATDVSGGANGSTLTGGPTPYGSTAGNPGVVLTTAALTQVAGVMLCPPAADLAVTNSAAPSPVTSGSNLTYTQTITNNGPNDATGVTLVEALPANTTFVSFTAPAGWSCALPAVGASSGTITCSSADLLPLASAGFSLVVTVTGGSVITDTVSAVSSVFDNNTANNSATVSTGVQGASGADVFMSNAVAPNPVAAGGNLTYTQGIFNSGPAAATPPGGGSITVSQTTPLNTTFQSMTPSGLWSCATPPVGGTGAITCSYPLNTAYPASASDLFVLVLKVNPGTASGTTISDTVTAGNITNDPILANNAATATTIVSAAGQADLALATVPSPNPVMAGNNITYSQTITNNGPATAANLSFTQATPANTTFQSVSPPVGWSCTTPPVGGTGTITCTAPTLAAGATVNLLVSVNVASSVADGSTITASSSVSSTTSDPVPANNSTTSNTGVIARVNLSVSNAGTPSPVALGGTLTYAQVVSNSGPSDAVSATFAETLPANVGFQSIVIPAGWSCPTLPAVGASGPIACTAATAPAGSAAAFSVKVTVNSGASVTDTATVGSASFDTVPGDNSATSVVGVGAAGQADFSVTNTGPGNPVTAGTNVVYSQVVSNNGPATGSASTTITET